jgi:hypothetical protein
MFSAARIPMGRDLRIRQPRRTGCAVESAGESFGSLGTQSDDVDFDQEVAEM